MSRGCKSGIRHENSLDFPSSSGLAVRVYWPMGLMPISFIVYLLRLGNVWLCLRERLLFLESPFVVGNSCTLRSFWNRIYNEIIQSMILSLFLKACSNVIQPWSLPSLVFAKHGSKWVEAWHIKPMIQQLRMKPVQVVWHNFKEYL